MRLERFFDILFSSLALILFLPILISIMLILKLTGEGEIFFLQERVGKKGDFFKLFKFATMKKNSPNVGTKTITMKGDNRILFVGKYLRKTKINELPQLLNIFYGDMSFIGPRPLTAQTFDIYSTKIQKKLKTQRPGLSGIGSIVFRHEEEMMHGSSASVDFYEQIIAPYKGSLEEWFILNKCLKVYFAAIFVTVWTVFSPNSTLVWKVFKNLPEPPDELKVSLNYRK